MSLFAGAWTVGSAKQLAEAGAASVTFYETTGWRGIKETDQGCPLPEVFASFPGMVYPVYHVLADLADLKNGEVVTCRSSDPQKVQALAILLEGDLHILIANLTPQSQDCSIGPLGEGLVKARSLDTSSAQTRDMPVPAATLSLTLCPYSVVRIDPSGMSPRKEGIQA
jgi:hypothetical protein